MPNNKSHRALSPIQRKILSFFLENQGSVDTSRGVSACVNESLKTVRAALEDLAARGFLKAHRTTSTVGYSCALSKKDLSRIIPPLNKGQ